MKIRYSLRNMLTIFGAALIATTAFAETKEGVKYSDTWLQAKLETTYMLNRNLGPFAVDTDVRDRVAHISGKVETPIQKELAEQIAKSIDGITSVENKIIVEKTARASDSATRSFGQVVEDLSTTASIKTKFLTDSQVSGLAINVDTDRSKVTLKGAVTSDAERQLAGKIAENTSGVEGVSNMLTVAPPKKES